MNSSEKITSQTVVYNGLSIRQILSNMHPKLRAFKLHRNQYINNCIEVYKMEESKTNLNYAQCVRNSNFILTKMYLSY